MAEIGDSVRQVVPRGSISAASVTFFDGDDIVDPGRVTVTVVRDDGTVVARDITADGTGEGARTFALSSEVTATLDRLRCDWVSVEFGALTTYVEVVGAHVASLGLINAILDQRDEEAAVASSAFSLETKAAARVFAMDAIEQKCGVAFSPRYASGVFDGTSGDLLLPTPKAIRPLAARRLGAAFDVADVEATADGLLYRPGGWPGGRREYWVAWEHGFGLPPGDVSRAVALLAVWVLTDGPWDDRGYGIVDGGAYTRLLTAGVAGASFSIPEVEAVVRRYRFPGVG